MGPRSTSCSPPPRTPRCSSSSSSEPGACTSTSTGRSLSPIVSRWDKRTQRNRRRSRVAEQNTEQNILVRQVTDVHANWSEQERGGPGKFSYQLILDNGAEEYAIRPEAEDADVLIELFKLTDKIYFDMSRQVLIFGNIPLGG